jgi:hypothetical protein
MIFRSPSLTHGQSWGTILNPDNHVPRRRHLQELNWTYFHLSYVKRKVVIDAN